MFPFALLSLSLSLSLLSSPLHPTLFAMALSKSSRRCPVFKYGWWTWIFAGVSMCRNPFPLCFAVLSCMGAVFKIYSKQLAVSLYGSYWAFFLGKRTFCCTDTVTEFPFFFLFRCCQHDMMMMMNSRPRFYQCVFRKRKKTKSINTDANIYYQLSVSFNTS